MYTCAWRWFRDGCPLSVLSDDGGIGSFDSAINLPMPSILMIPMNVKLMDA